MTGRTKKLVAIGVAAIVALQLFVIGVSYPLSFRVRGDAYAYLAIADRFKSFAEALAYTGERTMGLPFFDFVIGRIVGVFAPGYPVMTWVNAICLALLCIHLLTAWLFSRWAKTTGLIASETATLLLFVFFATFPALIGHTTSPLSDTLAVDLVVCAFIAMQGALGSDRGYRWFWFAGASALLFGFSILVRPGNLSGVAAALAAGLVLTVLNSRKQAVIAVAIALGCALVLVPSQITCARQYGVVCLQSPQTFDPVGSAQEGLRGARVLWREGNATTSGLPVLPDPLMLSNYSRRCQLKTIFGTDESSLTGCLVTRPLALPAYLVKKWVGLFDHFRFTPYLEEVTPSWLRWLSRGYDSLAWIGLWLFFLTLAKAIAGPHHAEIRGKVIPPVVPFLLAVYSLVMLAQQTVLHVEERYGFPVLPLCALVLVIYGERLVAGYRLSGLRRQVPYMLYGIAVWAVFVAQIIIWDNAKFS